MIENVKKLLKEGRAVIGTEQTIKNLKHGKVEKVFLTSNCPDAVKERIQGYSEVSDFEIVELEVPNDELGILCRKPFPISVLSVKKK